MKKEYIKPELEIIEFTNDDIITDSQGDFGNTNQGTIDVFPKPNNPWW